MHIGDLLAARIADGEVRQMGNAPEMGHGLKVDVARHTIADEEESRFAVIDYVVDLLGLKLALYGHYDAAIGQCGEECHRPVGTVAPADGHLVATLQPCGLHADVEFCYAPRHIAEAQCFAFIVGEGILVPILYKGLLYMSDKALGRGILWHTSLYIYI